MKLGFSTNQFSGPMNPIITSGASDLPPFKVPPLRRPMTKAAMEAFVDEVLLKMGANLGQWWDQVGGPHLAKGGSHAEFKKMMASEGWPEAVQKKFLRVAAEKYPEGHNIPAASSAASVEAGVPSALGSLGMLGSLAVGARLMGSKENQKEPHWKGRLGAHLMTTVPLAYYGQDTGAMFGHRALGGALGAGVGALAAEAMHHGRREKHAASAPTRGNFMMASDLPAWRAPQLQRGLQKNSGETSMPTDSPVLMNSAGASKTETSRTEALPKTKTDAFLPDGVTYSQGDFKQSKYAMPTELMSLFVEELRKEGEPGVTPAGRLAQTMSVGAPKVTAPAGPSIADQVKPRGAKFGIGIPGAFKTKI